MHSLTLTDSPTHSLTHSYWLTYLLTHSLTHSPTNSLTPTYLLTQLTYSEVISLSNSLHEVERTNSNLQKSLDPSTDKPLVVEDSAPAESTPAVVTGNDTDVAPKVYDEGILSTLLTHSLTHSINHSITHSLTHLTTFLESFKRFVQTEKELKKKLSVIEKQINESELSKSKVELAVTELLAAPQTQMVTYSLTSLLTYSLTHLLSYSLTHSLTHLLTHSLTYSLTHLLRMTLFSTVKRLLRHCGLIIRHIFQAY